jgi:hypothetical protein
VLFQSVTDFRWPKSEAMSREYMIVTGSVAGKKVLQDVNDR